MLPQLTSHHSLNCQMLVQFEVVPFVLHLNWDLELLSFDCLHDHH